MVVINRGSVLILTILSCFLCKETGASLPGRSSCHEMYYTQVGNAKIFFYMTKQKENAFKECVYSVNENLLLTLQKRSESSPFREVVLTASKFPNPLDDGSYVDPTGRRFLDDYIEKMQNITEKGLNIQLNAISYSLNLLTNFDAQDIHQENFQKQYEQASLMSDKESVKYNILQDLTSTDWQMARGTFAASLFQNRHSEDRYLMVMLPNETVGIMYTEPLCSLATTFTAHLLPIDFQAGLTSGSWKGKTISTSIQGLVRQEEVEQLTENAIFIPIEEPKKCTDQNGIEYPNGVVLRQMPLDVIDGSFGSFHLLPDQENTTIFELANDDCFDTAEILKQLFTINGSLAQAYRLIKRDGGFSSLAKILPNISATSVVVMVNDSHLPKGYKYYTIAENCMESGKPWIHLYPFSKQMAMKIPVDKMNDFSLTPLEELLYRDEKTDAKATALTDKLVTDTRVYIFN